MIDLLLSCTIQYKAHKPVTEVFLFRKIENIIFKAGQVKGEGSTLEECKTNALIKIKNQGFTITYSKVVDSL